MAGVCVDSSSSLSSRMVAKSVDHGARELGFVFWPHRGWAVHWQQVMGTVPQALPSWVGIRTAATV